MTVGCVERFDDASYAELWARQKDATDKVASGRPHTLFLGTHSHVVTLGRGTERSNLLFSDDRPVVVNSEKLSQPDIFEVERGGDVTYHGPGQLVGYPILNLEALDRKDLHRYLRDLEEVQIRALKTFDLEGGRKEGLTGVWIGERKIASIGVAVRRWVSYHGFALNVATDLRYFQLLNPCGLDAAVMTSLSRELGRAVEVEEVVPSVLEAFNDVFGISFNEA